MAPSIRLGCWIAGQSVKPDAIEPPSPRARRGSGHSNRRVTARAMASVVANLSVSARVRAGRAVRPRPTRALPPDHPPPTASPRKTLNPAQPPSQSRPLDGSPHPSKPPTRRRLSAPPHRRKPRPSSPRAAAGPPRAMSPSGPPPATRASSITFSASPSSPKLCRTCSDSRVRRSWSSTAARR